MIWQLPVHSPLPIPTLARTLVGSSRNAPAELTGRLARRYGVDPASISLTRSGTEALQLAIQASVRASGRGTVALPAYTCWDVGTAAQGAGARAVYYDLVPGTLEPEPSSVEAAVSAGVAALVVSPLFGYPVDWAYLRSLCEREGSALIEDAAQAHGSSWRGRPAGSFGDLSVLSFGRGKGWTGAGGGALLARSPEVAREVAAPAPSRSFRSFSWAAGAMLQGVFARPWLYGLPAAMPGSGLGESTYREPVIPEAMGAAAAALVLATEGAADAEAASRPRRARIFMGRLPTRSGLHPVCPGADGAGFLRLPLRIESVAADWVASARRLGIQRAYPLALPDVRELSTLATSERLPATSPSTLTGARSLATELFTLPTHSYVGEAEMLRITRHLAQI